MLLLNQPYQLKLCSFLDDASVQDLGGDGSSEAEAGYSCRVLQEWFGIYANGLASARPKRR